MPRIPTRLLRKAHAIDPLLPALLAPCRDLGAAQSELRWLREHVERVAQARRARGDELAKGSLLRQLVKERASGKPLQYMLGTEYFGDLEIRCRPGVLIPRQDTAASIMHLVQLLRDAPNLPSELRLLDLCTGTGCIPLLFRHELRSARQDVHLRALAVDVSEEALALASHNLRSADKSEADTKRGCIDLLKADVLLDPFADQVTGTPSLKAAMNYHGQPPFWDILISNPPYISPSDYWKTTTRSVRGYEPKLALVPPQSPHLDDTKNADAFYSRLLDIARGVEVEIVLLEVADLEQAHRVAQRARELDIFDGIEIWRENPGASTPSPSGATSFAIVGEGNGRSVLCWRGAGSSWLGKATPADRPHDAQRLPMRSSGRTLPVQSHTESLHPHFDPRLFLATSQSNDEEDIARPTNQQKK